MKLRLTLDTGKEVIFDAGEDAITKDLLRNGAFGEWLVDVVGNCVHIVHVIAIEPITEADDEHDVPIPYTLTNDPEPQPSRIIDGEGDEWLKAGDRYAPSDDTRSLDFIRKEYGIKEEHF